jgi:hypothetical protein
MQEIDELYADSGEPVKKSYGVNRATALKVGGFGLVGALAAFFPGRAASQVKKVAANSICQGTASFCIGEDQNVVKCGFESCVCLRVYYGMLIGTHGPVGACANPPFDNWDPDGDTFGFCGTPGQKDCPGNCYPSVCPGPHCPSICHNKPCRGPRGCPGGTFCADPYSLFGCGAPFTPGDDESYPVCAPYCGSHLGDGG